MTLWDHAKKKKGRVIVKVHMRDHETTDEESETESSVTDTESDVSVDTGDEAVG